MRMATTREMKAKLNEYLKLARDEVVVITRHGKPAAVLEPITEDDLEEILYETSDGFRRLIEARRKSVSRGIPLSVIKRRLPRRNPHPAPALRRTGSTPRPGRTATRTN
jgi:prevent-host-death family protein